MNSPHLKSKSKKTAILLKHPSLKKYIPTTTRFTRSNLQVMLMQYDTVFAKPDKGRFGIGVIKIQQWAGGYTMQYLRKTRTFDSLEALFRSIKKRTGRKKYIIQQGIHLTTYRNRPFDIRIMAQRTPSNVWETTGILARVAAPGRIVTNFHSGGTAHPLLPLLTKYMSKTEGRKLIRQLRLLGRKLARHYHRQLRGLQEIGIDVALDRELRLWILEVNTRPDAFVFNELKNKSMFRNIYRYARKYGKYKNKQK